MATQDPQNRLDCCGETRAGCKIDILEGNETWTTFMWPSDENIKEDLTDKDDDSQNMTPEDRRIIKLTKHTLRSEVTPELKDLKKGVKGLQDRVEMIEDKLTEEPPTRN